jgi:hypothetical protein
MKTLKLLTVLVALIGAISFGSYLISSSEENSKASAGEVAPAASAPAEAASFLSAISFAQEVGGSSEVASANGSSVQDDMPDNVTLDTQQLSENEPSAYSYRVESGDPSPALTSVHFAAPTGITIDASGNLYVTDAARHVVRRITPAGVVSTWAGTSGSRGNQNGTGTDARFNSPKGLAKDADRSGRRRFRRYVCDRDCRQCGA